jgi:arylsulfatase A-like enzyme
VLATACARPETDGARLGLLAPDQAMRSLDARLPPVGLDFRGHAAFDGLNLPSLRLHATAGGLDLVPLAVPATFALDEPVARVRAVEVELRSAVAGRLALRWAPFGGGFSAARSAVVPVAASAGFERLRFELPAADAARQLTLELELSEPRPGALAAAVAAGQVAATLRAIRFESTATPDPDGALVGTVRVGRDLRWAAALPRGASFELALPAAGRQLFFGVARRADGEPACSFEARLEGDGAESKLLLAAPLDPRHAARWQDYSVRLSRAKVERRLRFAYLCPGAPGDDGAGGWSGAAFVSNPELRLDAPEERPDLLLVSLDTVSAELFDEARRRGFVPHLDRVARGGVSFRRARAQSSRTPTAHAAMLTGLLPAKAGVIGALRGATAPPTLAWRLRAAGYATTAITGGILVSERLGHDRGFELFWRENSLYRAAPAEQTDVEALVARAGERLARTSGGPRFLFLHTYEAHAPYLREPPRVTRPEWEAVRPVDTSGRLPLPRELLGELFETASAGSWRAAGDAASGAEALALAREAYLAELARIDRHLGPLVERFLAGAPARGAIVAVTADHGESFFQHGLVQHGLLEASNVEVPLFFAGRGVPAGLEPDFAARVVDVAPTLAELAGLEPAPELDGVSLVPLFSGGRLRAEPSYSFTDTNGFTWEAADARRWVTPTVLANENFARRELLESAPAPGEARAGAVRADEPEPELARWASEVFASFPGLHVDLSALAGRELEIDARAALVRPTELHGWDLTPTAGAAHGALLRAVRVGARGRLWLHAPELAPGAALRLRLLPHGASCALERPRTPDSAPLALDDCARALGALLAARRVSTAAGDEPGALGGREAEQLRALGYLR